MGIEKENNESIYGIGAPIKDIDDWKNYVKKVNEVSKEMEKDVNVLSEEFEDGNTPNFPCLLAVETFTLDELIETYENESTDIKLEDIKKVFKLIDEYPLVVFKV